MADEKNKSKSKVTDYQLYGLVGKGIASTAGSMFNGFAAGMQADLISGGYGMKAEAADLQASQVLLNGKAEANARLEQYNIAEASNVAMKSASGGTNENTIISDTNRHNADLDASLFKRKARMANISARSAASSARSAAKQSKIAGKAAVINGILGGISSASGAVGQYYLIKGGKSNATKPTK